MNKKIKKASKCIAVIFAAAFLIAVSAPNAEKETANTAQAAASGMPVCFAERIKEPLECIAKNTGCSIFRAAEDVKEKREEERKRVEIFSLTDEESIKVAAALHGMTEGTLGRLYSPDLGINVGLNYSDMDSPSGPDVQYLVDMPDSALLMEYKGFSSFLVADHWNQGFEAIKSSVPELTAIYRVTSGSVTKYVCEKVFGGYNVDAYHGIVDENGDFVLEMLDEGLCLYTCNESWRNVTVTFYKPVGTVDLNS